MNNLLRISNSLPRRSAGTFRLLSPFPITGASREVTTGGNGRFSVRLPRSKVAFNVRTEWRETCALSIFRLPPEMTSEEIVRAETLCKTRIDEENLNAEGIAVTSDADGEHVLVDASPEVDVLALNSYLIEAVIPEYSSVNLLAARGTVKLGSKVKGDCRVHLDEGDIDVHVVRGQHIHLSTGRGRVVAGELEGTVAIAATEVSRRQVFFLTVKPPRRPLVENCKWFVFWPAESNITRHMILPPFGGQPTHSESSRVTPNVSFASPRPLSHENDSVQRDLG